MNKNSVDFVAQRARQFNLDSLIDIIVGYEPADFKKQITRLYMFTANAAIHSDCLNEDDIEAIDLLQLILKSLEDVEDTKDALLVVRVK